MGDGLRGRPLWCKGLTSVTKPQRKLLISERGLKVVQSCLAASAVSCWVSGSSSGEGTRWQHESDDRVCVDTSTG